MRILTVLSMIFFVCAVAGKADSAQSASRLGEIKSKEVQYSSEKNKEASLTLSINETAQGAGVLVEYRGAPDKEAVTAKADKEKANIKPVEKPKTNEKAKAKPDEKTTEKPGAKIEEMQAALVGGEVVIYLDSLRINNRIFNGTELKEEFALVSEMLRSGMHTVKCEVNLYTGEKISREVEFQLNVTPGLEVTAQTNKDGVTDPMVKLSFFNPTNSPFGYLEVYLDENQVATMPVTDKKQLDESMALSKWIGKPLDVNSLAQGTHLLKIVARSISGEEAAHFESVPVNATPKLSIAYDKANKFKEATISFPAVEQGFTGTVNIFYKQGVISSQQVQKDKIVITRDDIQKAFELNKHTIEEEGAELVFSIRSANGAEVWQHEIFR